MARRSAFLVAMAALALARSPASSTPSDVTRHRSSLRRLALSGGAPGTGTAPRPSTASVPLDRVVAVVNNEALTQFDINEQKRWCCRRCATPRCSLLPPMRSTSRCWSGSSPSARCCSSQRRPAFAWMTRQSSARSCASRRKTSCRPEEFRKVLEREKIPYAKYREDIRTRSDPAAHSRAGGRQSRRVSDAELDASLATVAAQAGGETEYQISHVLVSFPEQASPEQINARRKRAEEALAQARSGNDFKEVAAAFSDAPDGIKGGDLGWRTPARLPRCSSRRQRE